MMSLSNEELRSLVKEAVAEALKPQPKALDLTCPDCKATLPDVPHYLDHRVNEYVSKRLAEVEAKIPKPPAEQPKPEELVKACEGPLCRLIEERYGIKPKAEGEEEEGSYKPPWRRKEK